MKYDFPLTLPNPILAKYGDTKQAAKEVDTNQELASRRGVVLKAVSGLITILALAILSFIFLQDNLVGMELQGRSGLLVALSFLLGLGIPWMVVRLDRPPLVLFPLGTITLGCLVGVITFTLGRTDGTIFLAVLSSIISIALVLITIELKIIKVNQTYLNFLVYFVQASLGGFISSILYHFFVLAGRPRLTLADFSMILATLSSIISMAVLGVDISILDDVERTKWPKRNEWEIAYGICFTIAWIFLSLLFLVASSKARSRRL